MVGWDYVLHADSTYERAYEPPHHPELKLLLEHDDGGAFQFLHIPANGDMPPIDSINQAYYYVAIRGIEALLSKIKELGLDSRKSKVQICTSRLVANQTMGKWQVNDSILFMLCAKLRVLLSEFREWEAVCKNDSLQGSAGRE